MRYPPPMPARRQPFKEALHVLESTQAAFCRQHRISQSHLQRILTGDRTSPRIEKEIDRVIAEGARRAAERPADADVTAVAAA